jgi:hypothetical protein
VEDLKMAITDEQGQALYGSDPGLHLGPYILALLIDALLLGVNIQLFIWWCSFSSQEKRPIKVLVVRPQAHSQLHFTLLMMQRSGQWYLLFHSVGFTV